MATDSNSAICEKKDLESGEDKDDKKEPANEDPQPTTVPCYMKFLNCILNFYFSNSLLCLVAMAILLAYAYPPLGAEYLQPKITATWIAVIFIFVLSGLGLKTEEFKNALKSLKFNIYVQLFNFGVVSGTVFGFTRLMKSVNALSDSLADGMVIGSCVPLTINMVIVLTTSSKGNEAAAIFNAACGNMLGIFVTPALILLYLGIDASVDIGNVFLKLALRVVLPIAVGQILQKYSPPVVQFVKKYKKRFKQFQEYALTYIIYTVFCKTFKNGSDSSTGDAFLMIALQGLLLLTFMAISWICMTFLFPDHPRLRVMGLFGSTHKSVAMGVPLINAIYESNTNVGLYTLPLLVWHPMQLVIGSFLAPKLAAFVDREEERMKHVQNNSTQIEANFDTENGDS